MAKKKRKEDPCQLGLPNESYRSPCPVARTLDLIGDKWTLLVIRDLLLGCHTYGEFANSMEAIPTNILADRLKKLVDAKLVEKRPYQTNPPRYEYHLTKAGKDLKGVVLSMVKWGLKHVPDPDVDIGSIPKM